MKEPNGAFWGGFVMGLWTGIIMAVAAFFLVGLGKQV